MPAESMETASPDPTASPDRLSLRRQAIYLQTALIGYNLVECLIALVVGYRTGSIALFGFGLDGALEITSSVVVLLHLKRHGRNESSPWDDRVARFIGVLLLVLAFYIFNDAMVRLIYALKPDPSLAGIVLAMMSLLVMFRAARFEHGLAVGLHSTALMAESRETLVCAWLSAALLVGLGANLVFGLWWVDPAVAVGMSVFIAREGLDAISGREAVEELPSDAA
jgi:divalent metal cation (Fe/Co/Zn/Cd) transporter